MFNTIRNSKKKSFYILFSISIILILGVLITLVLLYKNQQDLHCSQINRYNSYRLGNAIRESDDLLTEYCTKFIITEDPIWEKKYWDLVALRAGEIPEGSGWTTSILDSMYQMGFTKEEFDLLKIALDNSNKLVEKETRAFNASKGLYLDDNNNYTIHGEPNKRTALTILNDQDYTFLEKEVEEPLIKFEGLIEARTRLLTLELKDRGDLLIKITSVLIFIAVMISVLTHRLIINRLNQKEKLADELNIISKEQACLFKISQLLDNSTKSIEHILESSVFIIPFGWSNAEQTSVRIKYKEFIFTSVNFSVSETKQEAVINVQGDSNGIIEVFYNGNIKTSENTFSPKEQELIETIASLLSSFFERKKAQVKLILKEQQLQYALDVSNEGIWELYKEDDFINLSPKCYTLLGYEPVTENNKHIDLWNTFIVQEDREKAFVNNLTRIIREGIHDHIFRAKDVNGQFRWLHTKGKAVEFTKDNEPSRIVGTIADITDRIRQEEKIVNAVLETEDKERSRIAMEIHDGLQQTMSTSLLSFEKLKSVLHFENKKNVERYELGYQYLKKAIEESRTLAHNLMPKIVDDNGLVVAIEALISSFEESISTQFIFEHNLGDHRLKLSNEVTLYRIIQEAINNILKYSNAQNCTIQLLMHSDVLILTIEDNGVGFNLKETQDSFGINSMKTRAESVGAFFEINSKLEIGTNILVELPLENINGKN